MESLEHVAKLEWDLFKDEEGWVQKEYVALGFSMPEEFDLKSDTANSRAEEVWYELHNVAEHSVAVESGRGEFLIEAEELQSVMGVASAEGLGNAVRILWHTHTASELPSKEDLAEFPAWLVDYGMIFHVPTGKTTVYNSAGVISNSDQPAHSLTTGDIDG